MRVGLSDRKVNKIIYEKYKKLKGEQSVDNVESSSASDKAQSLVLLPFTNENSAQKAKNKHSF